MPQMNGLEAIDRIRATPRYRLRPIPIIAITANALMEEKSRFLKITGLTDYITKPVRKDALLHVVSKHLPTAEEKSRIMKLFPLKRAVGAE
jgi:CheY-like chemotaxis protein